MATVRNILTTKGFDIFSVSPDDTVLEALKLMTQKGIGAVLVMQGDRVVGVFSERDYAHKGVLKGCDPNAPVKELMSDKVYVVHLDEFIENCMALMTDRRIRHLPVMDNGKVVGVVSIGDVVKNLLASQESKILSLENYILGREYPS